MSANHQTHAKQRIGIAAALFFVVLSMWPLFAYDIGGDVIFHYGLIDCFTRQFWQGDLYPRWCYASNAGHGAPLFIFYFPLPYYVTALLAPLAGWQANAEQLYIAGCLVAGAVGFACCYRWLRVIAAPGAAFAGAILYLFVPYRMELLLFRSAYAELWCLAFLPLVFYYAALLARGAGKGVMPTLALAVMLCMLSHIPLAVIGVGMAALYLLVAAKPLVAALKHYVLAVAWAGAMAAFYIVPALLFRPFVTGEAVIAGSRSWSNDFLGFDLVIFYGHYRLAAIVVANLLAAIALVFYAMHRHRQIASEAVQRDIRAFGWIFALSFFLLVPLSLFVWKLPGISALTFPWRVQGAIALCIVFLFTCIVQFLRSDKQRKTAKVDFVVLLFLLQLVALFLTSMHGPEMVKKGREFVAAGFVTQREYRTVWTEKSFITPDYVLAESASGKPRVETLSGDAVVQGQGWGTGDVTLSVQAGSPSTVGLRLAYFPSWRLIGAPEGVSVRPEQGSGDMILDLPAGSYDLRISQGLFHYEPWVIGPTYAISVFSWLALAMAFWRRPYDKTVK